MATVTFPATIPKPLLDGYTYKPLGVFQRTSTQDGPPRYRLRSPRYTTLIDLVWVLTEGDFLDFRLFFEDLSQLGFNKWFDIPLAVGLPDPLDRTKRTLQTLECHFYEEWQAILDNGLWRVQATLEAKYAGPGLILNDNFYSGNSITVTRPTDIVTGDTITVARPADVISSGQPSYWD